MKFTTRLVAVFCLLFAACGFAAQLAPEALVRVAVDDVLAAIKQTKNREALRQIAEQKVLPHFDFTKMTRLAVGPNWRQANPAQQQALESAFRTLLVNTYVTALSQGAQSSTAVEIRPAQPLSDDESTVRTVIRNAGREPVTVDYRLARGSDGWKVFDVVVEGLSLVTNYRSSFASEINRSGIDGLIGALQEKNRSLVRS